MRVLQHRFRWSLVLMAACALYGGLPGFAADRQLQIAPGAQAAPERRIALVIGNSAYKASPLRNPVHDARAIAKALAGTGFKVSLLEDASQSAMRRAIRAFGDELQAGGVGLFYYAGHGMQVRGKNYLVPVNADIEREDEVEDQAVDADLVLSKMDSAKNALNIVILDACRNNPFARSFRSAAQGLAQMDAPSGTLIAFATAPGSVAADGDGENGLYTKHLLANLAKPGLPIEQLFKEVRIGVTRDTHDRQVPWESSSLKGDFFFVRGGNMLSAEEQRRQIDEQVAARVASERAEVQRQMQRVIQEMLAKQRAELEEELKRREHPGAQKPAAKPVDALQMELAFWDSIKNSTNPRDFQAYLEQYPKGTFAVLARARVAPKLPPIAAAPASKPASSRPAPGANPPRPTPPAKPEPVQVASVAPAHVLAGIGTGDPRFPKVGDRWVYEFVNLTNNRRSKGAVSVNAVSREGILDTGRFGAGQSRSRAHSAGPQLYYRGGPSLEFSPYLLSFGTPKIGEIWRNLEAQDADYCRQAGTVCNFQAKVVGREKVTTPAGSFDAVKVTVDLNANFGSNHVWREYSYWFAESAKRVVKSTARTRTGITMASDYDVELVSYKLN